MFKIFVVLVFVLAGCKSPPTISGSISYAEWSSIKLEPISRKDLYADLDIIRSINPRFRVEKIVTVKAKNEIITDKHRALKKDIANASISISFGEENKRYSVSSRGIYECDQDSKFFTRVDRVE